MKLIVCDVEGTIFKAKYRIEGTDYASTMWQPIAHRLGPEAEKEEKETHRKWENGEYKVKNTNRNNYIKWVEETIEIHKKYNLTKDVFYQLIDSAEYNDGVVEFFNNLNRDLYIPVLISGGFQELIRRAQSDFKIYYGYGACEYIWDKDDRIVSWSLKPSDFENKYDYVKLILSNYNLNEA